MKLKLQCSSFYISGQIVCVNKTKEENKQHVKNSQRYGQQNGDQNSQQYGESEPPIPFNEMSAMDQIMQINLKNINR